MTLRCMRDLSLLFSFPLKREMVPLMTDTVPLADNLGTHNRYCFSGKRASGHSHFTVDDNSTSSLRPEFHRCGNRLELHVLMFNNKKVSELVGDREVKWIMNAAKDPCHGYEPATQHSSSRI